MPSFALAALGIGVFGAFAAVAYWRRWQWTGLPAAPARGSGAVEQPAKTLWDWLQLLGIPVALATLAFLISDAQSSRDQRREDHRTAQQRRTAADAERENTLRTYLAQMSDLMLDRGLLRSKPGADVREIARTATLTAVRRLDGPRRGLVVQFLAEAQLLRRDKHTTVRVTVASADLTHAVLSGADLSHADLSDVNLSDADLSDTRLRGANLGAADLSGADLSRAGLSEADLSGADLSDANLSGAGLGGADLGEADLGGADLGGADLSEADLSGADLSDADLGGADLSWAEGVDITGARGKPAYPP